MPYPIPDDLDNIEGWRWYLVPLPDNDQMVQVAWGMWSELTNYWMWGEEGPVPEQSDKAAQLWAAALYEAWRVRDMGFPDDILNYIDEVESLLRQLQNNQIVPICCDDIAQVEDVVTTEIVPDEGTAPETWSTETVSDWAEWRTLVCGAANGIVDELIAKVNTMDAYAGLGFVTTAAVLALMTGLAQVGILALSVTGLGLAGGWYALTNGLSSWSFQQIASDLEDARQDIICAIFVSTEAFEAAIQGATGLSWAFFSLYNWENIRNAILEGSYGDQDLTVNPSSSCDDCEYPLDDINAYHITVNAITPDYQDSRMHAWVTDNGFMDATQMIADGDSTMPRVVRIGPLGSCDEIVGGSVNFGGRREEGRENNDIELRLGTYSFSSHDYGGSVTINAVCLDGQWLPVTGLTVVATGGTGGTMPTVDGNTIYWAQDGARPQNHNRWIRVAPIY